MLRLGDAQTPVNAYPSGVALPLFVDHVRVRPGPASVVYTAPLPTTSGDSAPACTLAAGDGSGTQWNFDADGLPSNTADLRFGLIPCYDAPVGEAITRDSPRTIARVGRGGSVDTSISGLASEPADAGWRQVASADGSTFYTAQADGFRFIPDPRSLDAQGRFVSTRVFNNRGAGSGDARTLSLFRDRLYVASGYADRPFDTITLAGNPAAPAPVALAGQFSRLTASGVSMFSPWTFCWGASWRDVYVAIERSAQSLTGPRGVVQLWQRPSTAGGTFVRVFTIVFSQANAVYSIAGRPEFGSFVLYGVAQRVLYRYDTAGIPLRIGQALPVHTAAPGTQLRGVFFGGLPAETQTPSQSPSAPRTRLATVTAARTVSPTRSRQPRSRTATRTRKPRLV